MVLYLFAVILGIISAVAAAVSAADISAADIQNSMYSDGSDLALYVTVSFPMIRLLRDSTCCLSRD